MAVVWIPSLMQKLTGGQSQVEVEGKTVRQIVEQLEATFPGFRERLCADGDQLKPDIAVAVDGEVKTAGLRAPVRPESEIHFIPALAGG